MDVIRSNYSTVGPYAQKEAPSAPDYPYSQIMAAYRGALEAIEQFDDSDNESYDRQSSDGNGIGFGRNHTKAFQRILNHFFGDYFKEDADEEMASDMSERWASFARRSNPNYDGSKADWLPWRHQTDNFTFSSSDETAMSEEDLWGDWNEEEIWEEYDEYDSDEELEMEQPSMAELYRRKALELMQMDVVVEDVFRTELKRKQYRQEAEDEASSFLKGNIWKRWYQQNGRHFPPMARMRANDARRFAQELGVMGIGLSADRHGGSDNPTEIYFPELLELTWPPEVRYISNLLYHTYSQMIVQADLIINH